MARKKPAPKIIIQYSENTLSEEEQKAGYKSLIKLLVDIYLNEKDLSKDVETSHKPKGKKL